MGRRREGGVTLIKIPDAVYRGTTLPGGWETRAPDASFSFGDARMRDLVTVLKRYGASHAVAEAEALKRLDAFWAGAWRERIMKTVARWAHVYEREHGNLDGFDPVVVARAWVPGLYAGKQPHGNLPVREMLAEMRRGLE
jgi:hypothetical protein